ncbi:hypothetical protein [Leucobacter ruminantium]|uniref:Uncharacterized protein n=1 Tax=Leucobacter ruminantium TaxID=1289170 RepID=A0A939M3N6_9MICO|nr:hypothetical protein [Leucobacter ruminantium]MBO1806385.1 hypothetical protein [Leucobacter ruminantium]
MSETTPDEAPEMPDAHSWHVPRLIIAWAVAAVIGVLVTVLVPDEGRFSWLAFAIGASTLVTFALQLGTAQREGFITRTAFSVAGSVVVICVIDIVALLLPAV